VPCQRSMCLFTTTLGSNCHRIGWWRWNGVVLPCMPSYLDKTAIVHASLQRNTHATDIGEAVGSSLRKMGPKGASRGAANP
jgi:hypothetical protein